MGSASAALQFRIKERVFSRWLAGRGYTPVNVMDGVGQPKQPDIPVSSLSEPQIMAIREACRTDRERLVIGLVERAAVDEARRMEG